MTPRVTPELDPLVVERKPRAPWSLGSPPRTAVLQPAGLHAMGLQTDAFHTSQQQLDGGD